MGLIGKFPFGQKVYKVEQSERSPKEVFVLGVYASAVHARWINLVGKNIVNALAVASEPYIFWRGENSESIIQQIPIPRELGNLVPARQDFNGPSGLALDNLILDPLKLDRQQVWLCDLVPHSCVNPSQKKANERAYLPLISKYDLSEPSVPPVPKQLTDEIRRKEIMKELIESEAQVLVLLGDKPIQWFLSYFEERWKRLADFGRDPLFYGQLHQTNIGGIELVILPLAHPRQIARLGRSSEIWYEAHKSWIKHSARHIL